jgi:hypothetical protein
LRDELGALGFRLRKVEPAALKDGQDFRLGRRTSISHQFGKTIHEAHDRGPRIASRLRRSPGFDQQPVGGFRTNDRTHLPE